MAEQFAGPSMLWAEKLRKDPKLSHLSQSDLRVVARWLAGAPLDDPLILLEWDNAVLTALTGAWGVASAQATLIASLRAAGAKAHPDAPERIFGLSSPQAVVRARSALCLGHAGHPARPDAFGIGGPMAVALGIATKPKVATSTIIYRAAIGHTVLDNQYFDWAFAP